MVLRRVAAKDNGAVMKNFTPVRVYPKVAGVKAEQALQELALVRARVTQAEVKLNALEQRIIVLEKPVGGGGNGQPV